MDGCYKVVKQNLAWSAAGLACRRLHKDAHLLVINDEQEQLAVASMLDGLARSRGINCAILLFIAKNATMS